MKHLRIGFLTTVALLGVTAGCSKSGQGDDALANDVKAKLYGDPVTKQANIDVAVKDGVATLTGDVPGPDVELAAMKDANATAGIRSVQDQLKVNGTPAAQLPPAGSNNMAAGGGSPYNNNGSESRRDRERDRERDRDRSNNGGAPAPSSAANGVAPAVAPAATRVDATTIPAGERISVRMIDGIDSGKSSPGQSFQASLSEPLVQGDRVVIPAGAPAVVVLDNSSSAGRIKGSSELSIRLASVEYRGRRYDVTTSDFTESGKARGKQTGIRTGIGAAAGALIGGLAGGGKGAAIGAAAGGGAGLGYQVLTHGSQVKIPSETVVTFRLEAPLTLR